MNQMENLFGVIKSSLRRSADSRFPSISENSSNPLFRAFNSMNVRLGLPRRFPPAAMLCVAHPAFAFLILRIEPIKGSIDPALSGIAD
jgi:hypothetical protein